MMLYKYNDIQIEDIDEDTEVRSERLHLYLSNDEAFKSHMKFYQYLVGKDHLMRMSNEWYYKLVGKMLELTIIYQINDSLESDGSGDDWPYVDTIDQGYSDIYNDISELINEVFDPEYHEDICEEIDGICNPFDYHTFTVELLDSMHDMPGVTFYTSTHDGFLIIPAVKVNFIRDMDVFDITWTQES